MIMAETKKEAKKEKKPKKEAVTEIVPGRDPWAVLTHPLLTEKAIGMVERQNKLIFVVNRDSSKKQIKWAAEAALGAKVESVQTVIDRKGRKKAFIKLTKDYSATDIATRFGML